MDEIKTTDLNEYDDQGKAKLPTGLNVLTILTFVGCAFWGLVTIFAPMLYKFALTKIEEAKNSGKEFSSKELESMAKSKEAMESAVQNMVPMMVIGIVGIVLCLIGAIWMRKFKKDGYWMYVAGELAPIVAGIFIIGTSQYNAISSILLGIGIPVLFVILYTLQRKYLTK